MHLSGGERVRRKSFLLAVNLGRPDAHRSARWYTGSRRSRMCCDPVHHTGDAHSIFGRRAVLIRCRAVNVDRTRCLCLRVVSSARHLCPCAAASSACMWKVRESSRCTPRCFTVFDGWITVPSIATEGCVDGSCGRRLLQIGQKCIRPDFSRSYGRFN